MIKVMTSAADASVTLPENPRPTSRRGLGTAVLLLFAAIVVVALLVLSATEDLLAWDVRFAYLPAAEAVLDGRSPYPALDDPILEDQKGYVYPPQLVLALVPFTWLPIDVVAVIVGLGLLALVGLTLYVVEVRDIRCYAAAVLWVPSISGVLLGNVSIPLALALAVVWRYRERMWPPAVSLALSVSAKLVLWPMFVWMIATRRVRASMAAIALGVAFTLAAWAVIGFAGFGSYPDLVRRLSEIQAENSYSLVGMASTAGLGDAVGQALTLLVGGGLLAACVLLARRGDDVRSFTCAVVATLALSPIVWLHYLVVLLVPMAISRPRFTPLWLLPVLLWISPKPGYAEGYEAFVPAIAVAILVGVLLARPRHVVGSAEAAT